ncbi:hypothetical protein EYZ11_006552 [Aspergillus tanneri]|uniref:Uncharacterized protein n=1 Tax=Aspergillus tanneri TaxID=1220188 RepID=A0A4S3JFS8_9EURO|nr:hypothetical protein EYZ11_006552 [Aspergillus tanneri]
MWKYELSPDLLYLAVVYIELDCVA